MTGTFELFLNRLRESVILSLIERQTTRESAKFLVMDTSGEYAQDI